MIVGDNILTAGAELYGIDKASIFSMGGTDGAVYGCEMDGRACVIKFVPMEQDQIPAYQEKMAFVRYLANNGIPASMPLPSQKGNEIEQLQDEQKLYIVSVSPRAEGQHPTRRHITLWNDTLFERWGTVMGQMHALTQTYPCWDNAPDSPPTLIEGWEQQHTFFEQWCKEPKITEKWNNLYPLLAALPRDRASYGLVHNDFHQQNFFYHPSARSGQTITVFDFDVCAYNWFISDIAIAAYHAAANETGTPRPERQAAVRAFLQPFLRGYRQANTLDADWLEHLPLFMKYREILLYIALTNSWSEKERNKPWIKKWLGVKRSRTLMDEPII